MYIEKTYCKTEYVYRKNIHTAKLNMYIEKNCKTYYCKTEYVKLNMYIEKKHTTKLNMYIEKTYCKTEYVYRKNILQNWICI